MSDECTPIEVHNGIVSCNNRFSFGQERADLHMEYNHLHAQKHLLIVGQASPEYA